jgi:hypothetical protein
MLIEKCSAREIPWANKALQMTGAADGSLGDNTTGGPGI